MKVKIEIDTENAAFQDFGPVYQIGAILKHVANVACGTIEVIR